MITKYEIIHPTAFITIEVAAYVAVPGDLVTISLQSLEGLESQLLEVYRICSFDPSFGNSWNRENVI